MKATTPCRSNSLWKISTGQINTKVKTIRGGQIRDIEDCLTLQLRRHSDSADVIVFHWGTYNVLDEDPVHDIIEDYRNLKE